MCKSIAVSLYHVLWQFNSCNGHYLCFQTLNITRIHLMSSGTRKVPFSLCGSFNMTKLKGCLSLPSAGRCSPQLNWFDLIYVAIISKFESQFYTHTFIYLFVCLFLRIKERKCNIYYLFSISCKRNSDFNRNKKYQDLFAVGMGSCKHTTWRSKSFNLTRSFPKYRLCIVSLFQMTSVNRATECSSSTL